MDDEGYRNELGIVIDTNANEIKEFHERQKAFSLDDVTSLLRRANFEVTDRLVNLDGGSATAGEFGVFVCQR